MNGELRSADDFVHGEGLGTFCMISGRTAAWLESQGLDRLRRNARGVDPRIDRDLIAIHMAGLTWRNAVDGISERHSDAPGPGLMLTVQEAAKLAKMTPRGIRAAIEQNRLPAQKRGRQWIVSTGDLQKFKKATRRAA